MEVLPSDPDNRSYTLLARDEFYKKPVNINNTTVIFGHTTTRNIRAERYNEIKIPYTIWHDESGDKIGIDCGAAYPHGQLACLRLDDMQEFYVKNERNMTMPIDYLNTQIKKLHEYEKQIYANYPNRQHIPENIFDFNTPIFKDDN